MCRRDMASFGKLRPDKWVELICLILLQLLCAWNVGRGGAGLSECDDSNETDHKDGQITTILNLE